MTSAADDDLAPDERLTRLRATLEEQRAQRVEQLAQPTGEQGDEPDADLDVAHAQETTARHTLEEIEGALARMDDGSYGHCETCRQQIPVERLEIRPYTRFCVRCQAAAAGR